AWGPGGADELLEWLQIPARHRVVREGLLDGAVPVARSALAAGTSPAAEGHGKGLALRSRLPGRTKEVDLSGLVLLDLPDHDSTETSHHEEVDRVVALADVLVWVLDPQ